VARPSGWAWHATPAVAARTPCSGGLWAQPLLGSPVVAVLEPCSSRDRRGPCSWAAIWDGKKGVAQYFVSQKEGDKVIRGARA